MELSIIGKDSKVGNALKNSYLQTKYNLIEYSMRFADDIQYSAEKADIILYLIANTKTYLKSNEYIESLYSNCFLLAKYLSMNINYISSKPFIFMSSAKVYDIFPYSSIYSEKTISEIVWYPILFETAMEIINLCNTKYSHVDVYECLQMLLNRLIVELRLHGKFPIYSLCKVIGEIIIVSIVRNYFILRPTYLYGYQEKHNIIYCFIDSLFKNQDVLITSRKKDFVTYSTLINIIEDLITEETQKERIFNLSSCDIIDGFKLYEYAMSLLDIDNINPRIQFSFEKSAELCVVDNSLLINKLSKINKYHIETFDEGFKQIIYRYFIENVCKSSIYKEFIGGSFAHVYFTQNNQDKKHVYKICLGNGAENGNIKIIHEVEQLNAVKDYLKDTKIKVIIPNTQIISKTNNFTCIKQEHIEGINFIELFKHKDDAFSLELLDQYCKKILDIYLSQLSTTATINMLTNNRKRIASRLTSVNKINNTLFSDFKTFKNISINGIVYKNPLDMIDSLIEYERCFISRVGLCISGDPILDNFILKDEEFVFIDARGEDLIWENGLPFFDPYYDLAKIYFYFYGWKQVREELFTLNTNNYSLKNTISNFKFTGDLVYKYDNFSNECINIFVAHKNKIWMHEDTDIFKNKILFLAGAHFLSDTFPRIVGKGKHIIDQCFLEFLLGTKLINESVKQLQDSFIKNMKYAVTN